MTAQLALGTYRCRAIREAAVRAAASGAQWIDTAPNYATGRAQDLLAPALAAHPSLRIATKAGYFTAATGAEAVNAGVLTEDQAVTGHSLAPDYVRWQTGRNREQLGRERLDLVLLHNPERAHPGDRLALHRDAGGVRRPGGSRGGRACGRVRHRHVGGPGGGGVHGGGAARPGR
ncbi:aldo/keto reductase [Streptomyces avermitilis]|uniref:aldo/keto reductase n=1 Tax=Streptomyces avermitilis TaxID=33903 RepID=UPI003804E7B5